ncbi:hypothetical protein FQZ97_1180840 [compost metagenome]
MGSLRQQEAVGPVRFQVDAGHDSVPQQEGQHVIAEAALRLRGVDLKAVVEAEQGFKALPLKDQRVERAQQCAPGGRAWQFRLGVPVDGLVPAGHSDGHQPSGFDETING